MSTALYCYQHGVVERLTGRDVEDLIFGLSAHLIDEQCDPTEVFKGDDWWVHRDSWCPTATVQVYRDPEMFAESLHDVRELRLAVARRAREEWRRVGGGQAPRMAIPNPRGDGIRRAADLIKAGAPVGQVAAVLRDAAREHIKKLYVASPPATQVTIDRTLSMFPEAVELAGQVVELPPVAKRTAAEDFEDQVDREAGVPKRERRHTGRPIRINALGETECDVCGWAPERTGHARPGRDSELSVRMAHEPNGGTD